MAGIQEFRAIVEKSPSRANEEWLAEAQGREPAAPTPVDWQWSVRNVTAGEDVASGQAESEVDATAAADVVLHEARAAEKARLQREGWTFGLDSEEEIQAAYDAMPA